MGGGGGVGGVGGREGVEPSGSPYATSVTHFRGWTTGATRPFLRRCGACIARIENVDEGEMKCRGCSLLYPGLQPPKHDPFLAARRAVTLRAVRYTIPWCSKNWGLD